MSKEFEALPEHTNSGNGLTSGDKWLTSSESAQSLISRGSPLADEARECME